MFSSLLAILGFAALKKNSAVHFRVQRLHAPAEHFRPAGQLGHVAHGNSRFAQQLRGAAGGNNFDSQRRKLSRKFRHAGFVIDADQRPLDRHSRASQSVRRKVAGQCKRLRRISEGVLTRRSRRTEVSSKRAPSISRGRLRR